MSGSHPAVFLRFGRGCRQNGRYLAAVKTLFLSIQRLLGSSRLLLLSVQRLQGASKLLLLSFQRLLASPSGLQKLREACGKDPGRLQNGLKCPPRLSGNLWETTGTSSCNILDDTGRLLGANVCRFGRFSQHPPDPCLRRSHVPWNVQLLTSTD